MTQFLSEEYYNSLDFIPDFIVDKNGERFSNNVEFIKRVDDDLVIIFENEGESDVEESDVEENAHKFVIPLNCIVAADFDTKADVITISTKLNSDKISISSSELSFIKSFAEFLSTLLQIPLPADYNDPKYNKDETEEIDIDFLEEDDDDDEEDDGDDEEGDDETDSEEGEEAAEEAAEEMEN